MDLNHPTPEATELPMQGIQAMKAWLADKALFELRAADIIITNGIQVLEHSKRVELGYLCREEKIPEDGTIGYAKKRHETIGFMNLMRKVFLRNTMRHLQIAHQVIQLIHNLTSVDEKARWTFANDRSDMFSEDTTRYHERQDVLFQYNKLKHEFYPTKEAI